MIGVCYAVPIAIGTSDAALSVRRFTTLSESAVHRDRIMATCGSDSFTEHKDTVEEFGQATDKEI